MRDPEEIRTMKRKQWFKNHEKNKEKLRENYQLKKDYHKKVGRDNYHKNKERRANTRLKRLFNITIDQYKELFNKQNGVCAICLKPETLKDNKQLEIRKLAVDHCHETGKIRGLLCFKCNVGLGKFDESLDNLHRAINYLIDSN